MLMTRADRLLEWSKEERLGGPVLTMAGFKGRDGKPRAPLIVPSDLRDATGFVAAISYRLEYVVFLMGADNNFRAVSVRDWARWKPIREALKRSGKTPSLDDVDLACALLAKEAIWQVRLSQSAARVLEGFVGVEMPGLTDSIPWRLKQRRRRLDVGMRADPAVTWF